MSACMLRSLANRIRDLASLPHTETHLAMIVAYDNHCPEGEAAATLEHLGRTCNMHYALIELLAFFITFARASLAISTLTTGSSRPCALLVAACTLALNSFFAWHRSS